MLLLAAILFLAFTNPTLHAETPLTTRDIEITPQQNTSEALLELKYKLHCNSQSQEVFGWIEFQNRWIRFDLFDSREISEVHLGTTSSETVRARIFLAPNPHCTLESFDTSIHYEKNDLKDSNPYQKLALIHSPFLIIRHDQYTNRFTDLPLALGYSIIPAVATGNIILRYTMFFSDEDSQTSADSTDAQMARYGRRTDIEWIYEVECDPKQSFSVVNRKYQGGIVAGIGHWTWNFDGKFLPNSTHPILYNIANHNVFSDSLSSAIQSIPIGYHLVPRNRIEEPHAREDLMFEEPWIFKVSDFELKQEKKISNPSNEYLYILLDGSLRGKIGAVVKLDNNEIFQSGSGHGNLDRLGEDLFNQQAYTAVSVGATRIEQLGFSLHGRVFLEDLGTNTELDLKKIAFKKLTAMGASYKAADISNLFECAINGLKTECRF